MAQPNLAAGPIAGFQLGQQLGAGSSAAAGFAPIIDLVLERARAVGLAKIERREKVRTAKELAPIEVEKELTVARGKAKIAAEEEKAFLATVGLGGRSGVTPSGAGAFPRLPPGLTIKSPSGRISIAGQVPNLQRETAAISAGAAIRSIEKIRNLILPSRGGSPARLITKGLPGVEGSRELQKAFAQAELEIVTARGGKQLTEGERQLVRAVFPNVLDAIDSYIRSGDESVLVQSLDEFELVARQLIQNVAPGRGLIDLPKRITVRITKEDGTAVVGTIDREDFNPSTMEQLNGTR